MQPKDYLHPLGTTVSFQDSEGNNRIGIIGSVYLQGVPLNCKGKVYDSDYGIYPQDKGFRMEQGPFYRLHEKVKKVAVLKLKAYEDSKKEIHYFSSITRATTAFIKKQKLKRRTELDFTKPCID